MKIKPKIPSCKGHVIPCVDKFLKYENLIPSDLHVEVTVVYIVLYFKSSSH